jgi:hypothetical protein
MLSLNMMGLDQLMFSIFTHQHVANVAALFHPHVSSLQHEKKTNWIILALILSPVVLTLFILYYLIHPQL